MSKWYLSKSKILSGNQCLKRLYLEVNKPELSEVSGALAQQFATGHAVGTAAQTLWPKGHLITHDSELAEALRETQQYLSDDPEAILFEATFQSDGVLVRNDILECDTQGARLVEIKASTTVKNYHLLDVAIQTWVLQRTGIDLKRIELGHINTNFVYQGDGNYDGLFTFVDIAKDIREQLRTVPQIVSRLRKMLKGTEPIIGIGPHCHEPFECPFLNYCTPPQPEYPVNLLPRGGKVITALLAEGYRDLRDVPPGRLTNATHERIWRVTKAGKPELLPGGKELIDKLTYPRYYMDFETVQFAVPIWKGTRPYERLPFQWSCEIETIDRTLRHAEFLDTSGNAPMESFCRTLLDCMGEDGPIFVYNAAFEKSVLTGLAERFPHDAGRLKKLIERVVDLLPITRDHYYHPDMHGSWSIKDVLPTIAPQLAYQNLGVVQDGGGAPAAYLEILNQATPEVRRESLITDLLRYCERDTVAMVELKKFIAD